MAKINIRNIDQILLNVVPIERRFDSEGDLALHPKVSKMYVKQGYDAAPKSKEEAETRGQKHFNGLMSSFIIINVYNQDNQTYVTADIAPTRYLIGQAMRDIMDSGDYTTDLIQEMSPDMANVSLIAPVKVKGQYFLLSQIKGKALGSGQAHSGLVAGNINAKYLNSVDPLSEALKNECSEELGMDLSYLDSTSIVFMVNERETGQVNFASVARNVDLKTVLNSYEASVRNKLPRNENLEVMALSILPVGGLALAPLEDGKDGLKNIICYHPTEEGLVERVEDRQTRPYSGAVLDYLSEPQNVKFLLEKAGF